MIPISPIHASTLSHRLTPIPDPPFILPVLEAHPVRFEQFTIIASMVKFFATTGPIPIPVPPDIEADALRNWICEHFLPIEQNGHGALLNSEWIAAERSR